MSRETPEQYARRRSVTCNLCRQRKPLECDAVLCPHCERYVAWRKMEMPDGRERAHLQPWEVATIARNVEEYRARASLGLPLFGDEGEESAA